MLQSHIFFHGIVQGVGFRYTVQRYAVRLDLNGWVRNVPDGSVEVLVEGAKKDIEKLCRDVEEHFSGYIRNKEIHFLEDAVHKFTNFKIIA